LSLPAQVPEVVGTGAEERRRAEGRPLVSPLRPVPAEEFSAPRPRPGLVSEGEDRIDGRGKRCRRLREGAAVGAEDAPVVRADPEVVARAVHREVVAGPGAVNPPEAIFVAP